jgi:hypothetical protein
LEETKEKPSAVVVDRADLIRIVIPQESAVYFFTKPRHPAHPAAVRRAIVAYGNKSYIHTSGYYAGDRVAFLSWMERFNAQDRKLQRELQQRTRPFKSLFTQIDMGTL